MAKKKLKLLTTKLKPNQNLLLTILAVLVLSFLIYFFKNHYLKSASNTIPAPTATPSNPTETPTPTDTVFPTAIIIPYTPTPTQIQYKYILRKSTDEIHVHPNSTGFAIAATLLDERWNVVTNQDGFKYNWTIDNQDLVHPGFGPFDGCTQGIQPPCPDDHFSFYATSSGQTVIRVNVTKDSNTVAATTFPLIVEP